MDSARFLQHHLKIRQMVLLVELGRHHSILHAAKAANLSQPGASKLLAQLEQSMGVPLFKRLPRGVQPTCYGSILIRRSAAALAQIAAGLQELDVAER